MPSKQKYTPSIIYEQYVKSGKIEPDYFQKTVVASLQKLYECFVFKPKESLLNKIIPARRKLPARGIYIWGDVGRGKSMLMDIFFGSVPITAKKRIHFHSLMLGIHRNIHLLRQKHIDNPVRHAAKDIAKKTSLLCLDEFQVTDVADAMILGKLFHNLLEENVTIVITSNRAPEELYLGGLQREKFLDFVKLIRKHMDIMELASPHDYRMQKIKSLKSVYLHPLNKKHDTELHDIFANLSNNSETSETILEVQGRKLKVAKSAGKIASFTFAELCEKPLGAADYLAIAHRFDTVFISGIPLLSPEKRNEARRFVTLIDNLYDNRIKLICTADAIPEKIYQSGDGTFEFHRTVSRLIEMQSEHYLEEHSKL